MNERLQKIIANSGICSRRKAELLIIQNRVLVNGLVSRIGDKADLHKDIIRVDHYIIPKDILYKVILLNKPPGIISSCKDNNNRPTVIECVPISMRKGLHPIGRLDKESRGAILMTNNGLLTLHLTHPRYEHMKIYDVWVEGNPSITTIKNWSEGVYIETKRTKRAVIKIIRMEKLKTLLRIELREGMNRQIRRVGDKLGHKVIDLQRIQIANIKINGLQEGAWREVPKEVWQPLIE